MFLSHFLMPILPSFDLKVAVVSQGNSSKLEKLNIPPIIFADRDIKQWKIHRLYPKQMGQSIPEWTK